MILGRTWDAAFLVGRRDRPWYVSCAARPRGVASRLSRCDHARHWLRGSDLADRGTLLPMSVRGLGRGSGGMDVFGLWPTVERSSAGRSARLSRGFSIEPPGPVLAILAITPFLLIQLRPFLLRWKFNSLRARMELVFMKSIE
ncbi:unnamed protein product [Microthlaspi erraticum]|uniref:Uncharacterized protein n=1 Tax=Microthlaspi erraticum TaxID=1685480 RepID=A0A6D2IZL2_9BRAS|nr:unnamed protein product [Microthlaspi erraticum]